MRLLLIVVVVAAVMVFLRLALLSLRPRKRPGAIIPMPEPRAILAERRELAEPSAGLAAHRLTKKVAIITGAGSGIGRAIALAFAREGALVALVGRTESKLRGVAAEIEAATGKNQAIILRGDVGSRDDIERVVAETVARGGRLDILVNNAAALIAGTAESLTEAEWDTTFQVDVKSVWLLSRAALPHLRAAGGGSIINISSVLGLVGAKNRVAYAAAKGAVTLMTKAMALDHAQEQIRVNAICPGIVETDLVAKFITAAPDPAAARQQRAALHPLGRFGQPEDIARLALYLASDDAAWVTGVAYPIDGGFTAL